jgi:hypothetical protein
MTVVHRCERHGVCAELTGASRAPPDASGTTPATRIAGAVGEARPFDHPHRWRHAYAQRGWLAMGFADPPSCWLGQIGALLETLCSILEHLHFLERDQAATHHFIQLWEEFADFGFGIDNLDDDRQIK